MIPRPLADTSSKRPVGYLDTSTNEERRTSRDPDETSLDVSLADLGIPPWGDKTIPLDANLGDRERAISFPTPGRSGFERLYEANAGQHITHECFDTTPLRDLDPTPANERNWGVGPLSIALCEGVAPRVDPREFWMIYGGGQVIPPFANSDFPVHKLPGR